MKYSDRQSNRDPETPPGFKRFTSAAIKALRRKEKLSTSEKFEAVVLFIACIVVLAILGGSIYFGWYLITVQHALDFFKNR